MMDQYRVNHASKSYSTSNIYSSDYLTSVLSSHQNVSKSGTKAYINPQIVNYEYIKRSLSNYSLPATNKIHLNPNFKGNSFSDMHIINTQVVPGTANINSNQVSRGEFQHKSCITSSMVEGRRNDTEKASLVCSDKMCFDETSSNKSTSRFKKVNYPSELSECKYNKYTWSRDKQKNKYSINKKVQVSSADNVLVMKKDNSWRNIKPKTILLPASAYKYTAPKKILKYVNSNTSTSPNDKTSLANSSKVKIINKSKTKLINNVSPKTKLNLKSKINQTPSKRYSVASKFVYIKNMKSSTIKLASSVRNKYKYCKTRHLKSIKYKIDKRKKIPESTRKETSTNKMNEIWKLFPKNYYDKRRLTFVHSYFLNHYGHNLSFRKTHSWRRDQQAEVNSHRKRNHFPNKRVVNIGGILYKSTTNKLTIANNKEQVTSSKKIVTRGKGKKNYVLYVRGEKFILDKNGKTLKRQIRDNTEKDKNYLTSLKRIYLGGVTYVQKSDGVLIRTNVHEARNLVNQAKHKSIAVLSQLKKRSSLPCMIFHKFGKCNRHNKGLCIYKHDQKNVAICKKFLKGNCDNTNCLLSHEVIHEKMATCHFFLKGFCTRENCPFLHVKLNKNAAICENFLRGFCDLGKNCSKKHLYQCPEFDKFGKCSQGNKCHYPHKTDDKSKESTKNTCQTQSKSKEESKSIQYYTKSLDSLAKKRDGKVSSIKRKDSQNKRELKKVKRNKRKSSQSVSAVSDQLNSTIECVPKRVKLDKLPCFIPLKTDEQ